MIVIIPARYDSTRLPGKALIELRGKTLLERVFECACKSKANRIIVATDDKRIQQAALVFGAEVCMTSSAHTSGTERLAEVVEKLNIDGDEVVVNLQGDEPLMPGSLIDQVSDVLLNSDAPMSTACHAIESIEDVLNPNVVKVVFGIDGQALYFSRSVIPYNRSDPELDFTSAEIYYRHIGIYAYRAAFMKKYVSWPVCELEKLESLEQLRVLWNAEKITVCEAKEMPGPGIDTKEDMEKVLAILEKTESGERKGE